MELEPGRQIGRYVVEERVGEGGMAVVYRVRHAELEAPFALKVLTLTHSRTLERFLAEGRVQATLEHPNIVRVIDVLEVDNHPALLMELVEGPTLHDWLSDHRPTVAEAEALFRGIVAGVAHAHARGFVHRDLKPANVLLAPSESGPVPKIADFGIVKLTGEQTSGSTRTGMTMGTPQYMAPEQVRDAKSVDHRADVFSLGCILYELVVGHPPFQGDDVLTVLMASARGRYERPDRAVPELPARFVQAIDGCLRVDREARLPDCEAVLAVLDGRVKMPSPPSAEPTAPAPPPRVEAPPAAPATRKVTATPIVAAAGTGVVALGAAAGLLLLAFGLWAASGDPEPAAGPVIVPVVAPQPTPAAVADVPEPPKKVRCEGEEGALIGFVRVSPFLYSKGNTWVVNKSRDVLADRPRAENEWKTDHPVVCELPKGARVELALDPVVVRGSGTWVPIVGGSVR
jgi:hypothetical protein